LTLARRKIRPIIISILMQKKENDLQNADHIQVTLATESKKQCVLTAAVPQTAWPNQTPSLTQ
jgi:hypothetical protein